MAEIGRSRCRFGFAGDDIHHGGFAGAIRADDTAQFPYPNLKREVVERLKAVEYNADRFEIKDGAVCRVDAAGLEPTIRSFAAGTGILVW